MSGLAHRASQNLVYPVQAGAEMCHVQAACVLGHRGPDALELDVGQA